MSSEPLESITDAVTLRDMTFDPTDDVSTGSAAAPFERSYLSELVRLKQQKGLFRKDEAGITFVGERPFQTRITLPANARSAAISSRPMLSARAARLRRAQRILPLQNWI